MKCQVFCAVFKSRFAELVIVSMTTLNLIFVLVISFILGGIVVYAHSATPS